MVRNQRGPHAVVRVQEVVRGESARDAGGREAVLRLPRVVPGTGQPPTTMLARRGRLPQWYFSSPSFPSLFQQLLLLLLLLMLNLNTNLARSQPPASPFSVAAATTA
jgi:hypothetical protein